MGASFVNYQVRTSDRESCIRAAEAIARARALVTDAKTGWVSLYDENSESQDLNELRRIGKALSTRLATHVFVFLVHDSDFFVYLLYEKGELIDQFNSRPDALGAMPASERKKWSGQFKKLVSLGVCKLSVTTIEKVLGKKLAFEEERAREFGGLMGIDEERASTGFKYVQESTHAFRLVYGKGHSPDTAALVRAVEAGETETVRGLLAKNVSPNVLNRFGESLLVVALRGKTKEIAMALLDSGADPFFGTQGGRGDAVWAAATFGQREVLAKLLERSTPRLSESLPGALASAVLMGEIETVQDLLKAGADPNVPDPNGQMPLLAACSRGPEMIWEALAGQKFPPGPGGKRTDWAAMVEVLLASGADVNARTSHGMTALMLARSAGQNQIVDILIRAGADPNLKPDAEKIAALMKKFGSVRPKASGRQPGESAHLDPSVRKTLLEFLEKKRSKNAKNHDSD